MPSEIENFVGENVQRLEKRQQSVAYYLSLGLFVPYLVVFGFVDMSNAQTGVRTLIGVIELLVAAVVSIQAASNFFGRRQHAGFIKPFLTVSFMVMFVVSLYDGGDDGAAIYWLFTFPAAAFYLNGLKAGLYYNALFIASLITYFSLQAAGFLPAVYSTSHFVRVLVILLIINFVGFVTQIVGERFRREVVGQRERLRVLLGSLPAGVTMFEVAGGTLVATNRSAETLFGRAVATSVRASEVVDSFRLLREDGSPYPIDELPLTVAIKRGEASVKNDVFVARPDGTKIVLRTLASPVRDEKGRIVSVVAVWEDATKEFEVSKMKSDFISLASHQLRTPLTAIKWAIEAADDETAGLLSPSQRRTLDLAHQSTIRMIHLVNDLLNVSRIERGAIPLNPENVDVGTICEEAVAEIAPHVAEKGLILDNKAVGLGTAVLDQKLIFQVIVNLLSNAVKYTAKGGRIEIGGKRGAEEVELYVRDTGVGIPSDAQAHMFEKFYRAYNVATSTEGTGLGLFLVKSVIETSGGRVWFESQLGRGTTFRFTLPLAGVPAKSGDKTLIL